MNFGIDIHLKWIYNVCITTKGDEVLAEIQISLAAARVNAGLTQGEVADMMHVGKQTIVSWEKGLSEPKITQARQLSDIYGMPLDYIFLPCKSILNG